MMAICNGFQGFCPAIGVRVSAIIAMFFSAWLFCQAFQPPSCPAHPNPPSGDSIDRAAPGDKVQPARPAPPAARNQTAGQCAPPARTGWCRQVPASMSSRARESAPAGREIPRGHRERKIAPISWSCASERQT